MKKIILIPVVLIVAVFIGMPFITGQIAQSETEKLVERINQDNQSYGYTEVVKYERGFRSTKSSFKSIIPSNGDEIVIDFSCDGSHGVTSYTYECQIDSFGEYKLFVDQQLGGNDPLSLIGSVSMFGSIEHQINIEPIEEIQIDGGKVSSKGGSVNLGTNNELNEYTIDGDIGASKLIIDGATLDFDSVELNGDIYIADDGVQLGKISLVLSKLIYTVNNSTIYDVGDLKLVADSTENGQNIDFDYLLNAKDLVIKNSERNFPSVDKAMIKFSGEGFDRTSVAKLTKIAKEMSDNGDITSEQQAILIPAAEGLLKKGLGLSLDADIDFDEGEMTSGLNFQLIDDATITDFSVLLFSPESILEILSLEGDIFLPDSILAVDSLLADKVENSSIFNRKGDGFKTDIVLKKDNISFNGEKVTFEEFLDSAL